MDEPSGIVLADFASNFFLWDKCKWVRRKRRNNENLCKDYIDHKRAILTNYILTKFGSTPISDIECTAIRRWLRSLPWAYATRQNIKFTFGVVLEEAKRRGLISENPARAIKA